MGNSSNIKIIWGEVHENFKNKYSWAQFMSKETLKAHYYRQKCGKRVVATEPGTALESSISANASTCFKEGKI